MKTITEYDLMGMLDVLTFYTSKKEKALNATPFIDVVKSTFFLLNTENLIGESNGFTIKMDIKEEFTYQTHSIFHVQIQYNI